MGRKQASAILAALIAWPALAQDYTPVPIPGQIIGAPETMTPLNGGDDSTRLVQLGFPFQYFGQTFTQAWVSSNGFVSFADIGNLCCNGSPIEQAPRNAIYGLWTDLISGGNPYYRTNASEAVFGWYNTQEYGSGLPNTLEIALFPDGKVQWNYGDVNNQWHNVTAGLTGPTMADSFALFYGQNVNLLDNTSYVALGAPIAPQPEPEPPFTPVDAAPSVIASPIAQQDPIEEQIDQQQAEQAVQEAIAEQEVAETAVVEIVVAEPEETADETAVEVVEAASAEDDAERLSPDEVAALAAGGDAGPAEAEQAASDGSSGADSSEKAQTGGAQGQQSGQGQSGLSDTQIASSGPERRSDGNVQFFQLEAIEDADTFQRERVIPVSVQDAGIVAAANAELAKSIGEQTTTETPAGTYDIVIVDGPTFMPTPTTGMGDVSSPAGQAQQMELLGMNGMQTEMASGEPSDIGDINSGDKEIMTQLAAVPVGYSGYTQLRLPDAPFYEPREIYRGRRIPDANMALYRMMSGQDAKWAEMVGEQYE